MGSRTDPATAIAAPPFASRLKILIFDLDGTLIDSERDLAESVNAALRCLRRRELPHEQIAYFVGRGAPILMERALRASESLSPTHAVDPVELASGLTELLAYYDAHKLDHTRLYASVSELLPRLAAKFELAVLTNKPVRPAQAILAGLGVAGHFRAIYGGNSFGAKKPDPVGLRAILEELGSAASAAMMIGDSAVDVQTGRNAGTWTCGVGYGFTPAALDEEYPDWRVADFSEFAALLD